MQGCSMLQLKPGKLRCASDLAHRRRARQALQTEDRAKGQRVANRHARMRLMTLLARTSNSNKKCRFSGVKAFECGHLPRLTGPTLRTAPLVAVHVRSLAACHWVNSGRELLSRPLQMAPYLNLSCCRSMAQMFQAKSTKSAGRRSATLSRWEQ